MNLLEYYVLVVIYFILLSQNIKCSNTDLDPTFFPRTISLFFYASIISRIHSARHKAAPLGRLGGWCGFGIQFWIQFYQNRTTLSYSCHRSDRKIVGKI